MKYFAAAQTFTLEWAPKCRKASPCLKVGKSILNKLSNYPACISSTQNSLKLIYTETASKSYQTQRCVVTARKLYDHIYFSHTYFPCSLWTGCPATAKDNQHLLG